MAIIVKEQEQGLNWLAIGIGLFFIILISLLVYFLFLTDAPLIEKIAPTGDLQSLEEIQDYSDILNKPSFLSRPILPNPETGALGRSNPFRPY